MEEQCMYKFSRVCVTNELSVSVRAEMEEQCIYKFSRVCMTNELSVLVFVL